MIDYILYIRAGDSRFRSDSGILALLVTCIVEHSKESKYLWLVIHLFMYIYIT
jgi:hypothetical protein